MRKLGTSEVLCLLSALWRVETVDEHSSGGSTGICQLVVYDHDLQNETYNQSTELKKIDDIEQNCNRSFQVAAQA